MTPLTPGFMVIHANQLEDLRALAVHWQRQHPLGVLEPEVFLVQSNGIAQWLKQALTEEPGSVAAALKVVLPARFLWDSYRTVLGRAATPEQSPLDKAPLLWRLMRLLPSLLAQEVFSPLRDFLKDDADLRKRYQLAERLADLFDQYQVYRADWLADWARGEDRLNGLSGSQPLPADQLWQAALWRALQADLGEAALRSSRAGVHPRFLAQLRNLTERPAGLPRRITVLGISALPAQTLEALAALAPFCQILLCVQNPCQFYWGDLVSGKELLRHAYKRHAPRALADEAFAGQPLLAAWGKQGRDYLNLLDQYDQPEHYQSQFQRIDLFQEGATATLLGQLHSDILHLRSPSESRALWPALDPKQDHSLRFQIAHSALREVEILHDQLLAAFSEDASLRPREVIVMLPDVNSYAPFIEAVFGQYNEADTRFIPFSLADQQARGREPLLIALEHLLNLPDSRLPVSEVLDLLDVAALRRRLALAEEDLPLLRHWLEGAGVRWGLDAKQRQQLGLGAAAELNSWRFGLRRMLLGYAAGAGASFAGIEPYAEVGGLNAALLGPLSQLLERLAASIDQLSQPVPAAQWALRLRALLDDYFVPSDETEQALLLQLNERLDNWLALCEAAQLSEPLPLSVVREAWLAEVGGANLAQRFLSGAVNFCTLMPMRAIPFRQIYLLGMNDGDYPRPFQRLDFDLMANDYRPGDRSRREDDRYLLLEALLAARERLSISWVGRSIRDNSERPPSLLIGQLRDHLANCWRLDEPQSLLAALTQEHPLQPFSPRYFNGQPGLFSYAHEWAGVHQSAAETCAQSLPSWQVEGALSPLQLRRFLRNPVEYFFNQRLKVYLNQPSQSAADQECFTLEGLERYQLSSELLEAAKETQDLARSLQEHSARLKRSGALPLAHFGAYYAERLQEPVEQQLQHYQRLVGQWPTPCAAPLALRYEHAEQCLEGWLGDVRENAQGHKARLILLPGSLGSTQKKGKALGWKWHRLLEPMIWHLLAAASGVALNSILIDEDGCFALPEVPCEQAQKVLDSWLLLAKKALQEPLPVTLKTALLILQELPSEAQKAYEGDRHTQGEVQESASLARQFADFAALNRDGRLVSLSPALYQVFLTYLPKLLDEEALA